MRIRLAVAALLVCVSLGGGVGWGEEQAANTAEFSYYYRGSLVSLTPSNSLLAVDEGAASFSAVAGSYRLVRDALSDRYPAKSRSIALYRAATPKGQKGAGLEVRSLARTISGKTGLAVQPVFEQGPAILIPTDEVIVGFKERTSLAEARLYLAQKFDELGISGLKEHREGSFVLRIRNPSNGRAFAVARSLSALGKISFAEPNFVHLVPGDEGAQGYEQRTFAGKDFVVGYMGTEASLPELNDPAPPAWTLLASLGFESAGLPQGWQAGYWSGAANAYWGGTSYRKHGGTRSLHCASAGAQAVAPPALVPLYMEATLRSPNMNLSQYEEVYLEFWFYAKNETESSGISYDYPSVFVVDAATGNGLGMRLVTAYTGDLTLDPTTSNGWRRLLFRVPPSMRLPAAYFLFMYESDGSVQREGAYLDDIRIVGAADVDTGQISSDTYSARQYELKNVGQVAGLSSGRSDMHLPEAWEIAPVSPDVVVAVIDQGVELNHPDLNLATGYDFDGAVGGQPRGAPRGSHGTNCAGNLGAIKGNGIGVVGTAPGVRIMPVYWGETWPGDVARSIDVAVAQGARVLSNSWGMVAAPSADIEDAVRKALAAGRVVLFAAGNGPDRPPYSYAVSFPGNLTASSDVICVGASSPTDEYKGASSSDGEFAWGSSFVGEGPDVCAPGPWSYATDLLGEEGYNDGSAIDPSDAASADFNPTFSGTSSATPKVAGVVALMLSRNPALTPAEVKSILRSSADDIDAPGFDDRTGAGRVNAFRAVQGAIAAGAPPSVSSTVPEAGATGVAPDAVITALFSEPMDGGTINGDSFTLNNGVVGSVSYDAVSRTARFTPAAPLAGGTDYTAAMSTGVKDAAGTPMAAAVVWSFTTALPAPDGNLDGDQTLGVADALLALRMAVGLDATTAEGLGHGDLNRDGAITSADALLILRKSVGL